MSDRLGPVEMPPRAFDINKGIVSQGGVLPTRPPSALMVF